MKITPDNRYQAPRRYALQPQRARGESAKRPSRRRGMALLPTGAPERPERDYVKEAMALASSS